MEFLLFAIPIIILILVIIIFSVLNSDSKKYLSKLDNQKQIELEKLKQETISKIKKLKNENNSSLKQQLVDKNIEEQKKLLETIKKQTQVIDNTVEAVNKYKEYLLTNEKKENKKLEHITVDNNYKFEEKQTSKLAFNSKNLVRGIIANEYLTRKTKDRRYL